MVTIVQQTADGNWARLAVEDFSTTSAGNKITGASVRIIMVGTKTWHARPVRTCSIYWCCLLLIHCATIQNELMRVGFHGFEGLILQRMCISCNNYLLWSVVPASTHRHEKKELSLKLHHSISPVGEALWRSKIIQMNY